ncbi:Carotenoid oxygenase [Corchorus olitorius]|uniref:Carotenoid oxygenase n=1 Tax=Corchorus olitorius TaxID=93759 RepID=A0A1R3HAX9_9ROSI|nr:Carotenoid oxygenase [Corchorus olitorius]
MAPVDEMEPTGCRIIHGKLPVSLKGVYIRNGLNPQFLLTGTKAFRRIRQDMPRGFERQSGESKAWETLGLRFPIIWALCWPENANGPWWPAMARGGSGAARGTGHRILWKLPDGPNTSQHRPLTRPALART